jgi:hypothetical protein
MTLFALHSDRFTTIRTSGEKEPCVARAQCARSRRGTARGSDTGCVMLRCVFICGVLVHALLAHLGCCARAAAFTMPPHPKLLRDADMAAQQTRAVQHVAVVHVHQPPLLLDVGVPTQQARAAQHAPITAWQVLAPVPALSSSGLADTGSSAGDTVTTTTAAQTATSITTTTTTTTTTATAGCGGLMRCISEAQCSSCLSAINSTNGFPHTRAEYVVATSSYATTTAL